MGKVAFLVLLLSMPVTGMSGDSVDTGGQPADRFLKAATGAGALGLEFIGVPLLDRMVLFPGPFNWSNPLRYTGETEWYLQDKMWHLVGCSMFTNANYLILKDLLNVNDPVVLSSLMSLGFWTGMECIDGLTGSFFSVRDEIGNALGALYGMVKLKYPRLPIEIRVGIRDYTMLADVIDNKPGTRAEFLNDYYQMTYAELVYRIPSNVYAGVAVSTDITKSSRSDRFGFTMGYDLLNALSGHDSGWMGKVGQFASDRLSISIRLNAWKTMP